VLKDDSCTFEIEVFLPNLKVVNLVLFYLQFLYATLFKYITLTVDFESFIQVVIWCKQIIADSAYFGTNHGTALARAKARD